VLWFGVVAWSAVVGVALWWLLRTYTGPSILIVREGDSLQPALAERVRAWFRTDLGLQRIYPWILFGPYAALIVSYFPLERGRLRLSVPLNLLACIAFVGACHMVNAHTSLAGAAIVVFNANQSAGMNPGGQGTNSLQMQMTKIGDGLLVRHEIAAGFKINQTMDGELGNLDQHWQRELEKAGLTNTLFQLRRSFNSPGPPPGLPKFAFWPGLMDLLAFGAIAGLAHSVHFYRRFREREHRALFLESNLAHARLNALRAQLQPHFLFNSLNAVATLLRRDPPLAEAMLLSLSELLRLTLSQSERQEVSLREELGFVHRYLEIQQTRFGDKLRVEEDIESAALDCLVPTLLLQPLVENAIRHGIEPAEKAGLVRLTARESDGHLRLTVEDDGVGLPTEVGGVRAEEPAGAGNGSGSRAIVVSRPGSVGTGIGLGNLRARLETLYGAEQRLELVPRTEGGVVVRIEIPWRSVNAAGGGDLGAVA